MPRCVQVVAEINKRRTPGLAELPANDLVPKNVRTGSVSDPYAGEHRHCLNAVSRWFACDVDKFGYTRADTPTEH